MTETNAQPQESRPNNEPRRTTAPDSVRKLASHDLLQGAQEILIEHAGEVYRLRLTRNGKLILHK
jgi:hemin uptake protein HemP